MNNVNWREIDITTTEGARQLDRVVAERLFGVEYIDTDGDNVYIDGIGLVPIQLYSTDANAALKLAEEIPDFVLMCFNPKKGWHAEQDSDSHSVFSNVMPTPALAIVYAWLRFKERQAADLR